MRVDGIDMRVEFNRVSAIYTHVAVIYVSKSPFGSVRGPLENLFFDLFHDEIDLRWRWLGIPSDKRKQFVGNGCLGIQRNCCRGRTVEVSWYFGWTSWFSLCLLFNSFHGWVFRIQVNHGTTSKYSRISSGSTDKVSIFSRKNALFLTMYLLFWRGDKSLDNVYVGDAMTLILVWLGGSPCGL